MCWLGFNSYLQFVLLVQGFVHEICKNNAYLFVYIALWFAHLFHETKWNKITSSQCHWYKQIQINENFTKSGKTIIAIYHSRVDDNTEKSTQKSYHRNRSKRIVKIILFPIYPRNTLTNSGKTQFNPSEREHKIMTCSFGISTWREKLQLINNRLYNYQVTLWL